MLCCFALLLIIVALLLCYNCCCASLFSCLAALKVAPCFSHVMPCCTSLSRLVLFALRLVAHTLMFSLHGCSHLVAMSSIFSHLVTFEVILCSSCVAPCCLFALLHLVVMPCFFCVVPCCSCCFDDCTLLFTICCLQFVACALLPCHCALLVVGPCYLPLCLVGCWALLPCHHCLAITPNCLPFSSTSYPPPTLPLLFRYLVICCFALLFCFVSWYSLLILLCKWRSLEQHQQASSNNRGFSFPHIFLSLFFLCFVFCLFVLFLFVIFF